MVTEATTSKIQKAEKIPMNESTENFKNFARPRRGDRHFREAAVHTNVQGNPDPEPRLAQGAAGEDGWRRGRAGAGPGLRTPTPPRVPCPSQLRDSPCILAAAMTSPAEMLDTLTR